MSFIERFFLLCPLFGVSFIGGSTVYDIEPGKAKVKMKRFERQNRGIVCTYTMYGCLGWQLTALPNTIAGQMVEPERID